MILHRDRSRLGALALSFVWLYAFTLAVLLLVGPVLMALLAVLVDGETVGVAIGIFEEVVLESYSGLVLLEWVPAFSKPELWVMLAILGGWVALQVLFLSPIIGPPRIGGEGRALLPSVLAAAFIASTGCAILWWALCELGLALVAVDTAQFSGWYEPATPPMALSALAVWTVGGFVWYRLLHSAGSRHDPAGLDRILRRFLAGTAVETALGTLAILVVRRRHDCVCASASFGTVLFSMATLVWLCGPWAVLFATRAERSRWRRRACRGCGYLRAPGAGRCAECGLEFEPEATGGPEAEESTSTRA